VLAPGNRADVVITPTRTGHYTLIADTLDRGNMGAMMGGGTPAGGPVILATLSTTGTPATTPTLPKLPKRLSPAR
jgi:hypothetical protein